MKRLIEHIIFAVALLAIFTGCQDEELYTSKDRVKEGVPVQVSLGFKVDVNKLLTRAAQEDKYEYWLDNIYVLIFDGEGNRIKTTDDNGNPRAFFQAGEEGGAFNPSNGGTEVKGILSFKTVTANDARIVGVANLHTATSSTAYSIAKEDLDKVETLADLQAMVISIQDEEPIERGGLFMMTGYAEDENGNNKITISGAEGGVTDLGCTLKLRRVDAKVEVRMTAEAGNASWKHFSFRPNQWQVMRVPKQSLVLPAEKANEKGNWDAEGEYVNTQAREFEELVRVDNNNEHLYAGGNFIFYMPENRKTPKKAVPSDGSYALRDEMNSIPTDGNANGKPGQEYENTDFMYANDDATYLVLTGHLSYTDENGKEVNADTRYIIHLGYADTPKDVNDYNTRRNGHYVYNIKVKGVHMTLKWRLIIEMKIAQVMKEILCIVQIRYFS